MPANIAQPILHLARPLSELKPDPKNARKHSDRNIGAIVTSLRRFGQLKPIVADSTGVVRAGNGTVEAARKLGWDRLAVVVSDLPLDELKAFAIADNRTAELAEWDFANLSELLSDEAIGDVGFTDEEVAQLVDEPELTDRTDEGKALGESPLTMAWVLVGVPLGQYGEAAALVEQLAAIPGSVVETTANGAPVPAEGGAL